jgi:hypothetical protein
VASLGGDCQTPGFHDQVRTRRTLARCCGCVPVFDGLEVDLTSPCRAILLDRHVDGREQVFDPHRLSQEVDSASLHGPHACRDISLARQEHDGSVVARGGQLLLHFKTVDPVHRNVEQEQPGIVGSCCSRNSWAD